VLQWENLEESCREKWREDSTIQIKDFGPRHGPGMKIAQLFVITFLRLEQSNVHESPEYNRPICYIATFIIDANISLFEFSI
jgi:hypothetical protein